jgi:pimeloyl-ACP methyl ester carboxylesterase
VPHIKVDDIRIYYEIHGEGKQTFTMIRGLGSDLSTWSPQIPEVSKHFRTVVFDNRGAGRTDKPDGPYSIRQMAQDVNGLLDALNVRRTALLGISMGGMIAQEFAIAHPEKLSCLILGCTTFGGSESIPPSREILNAILAGVDADEKTRGLQEQALFCDHTISNRRDVIAAFAEARGRFPIPPDALARQAAALRGHDTANRLQQVQTPTLVITGSEDRLIPPDNSRLIAERIPGAILKKLPGGHLFMFEYPEEFNRAIIEFAKPHEVRPI